MDTTKINKIALAYHEAGHAIVSIFLEIPFSSVSIIETQTTLGRVLLEKLHLPFNYENDAETRKLLDKIIQITLAGSIAETKFTGEKSQFGDDDIRKCILLINQFWGSIPKLQQTYFDFMKALTESHFTVLNARQKSTDSLLWKKVKTVTKQLLR